MRNSEAPREQPRSVLERLTDEHANEEDIERVVAELPEESDVYRAVVAEGQKLDQRQRQIVGANLQRLSERVELKAKTQVDQVEVLAKVERMRTALAAPPETRPPAPAASAEAAPPPEAVTDVPVVSSPFETEKSPWTRGWEQAGKYWNETSPTVKAVSVGVGVAAFAYGAYRLVKWLWGGTKKVAEKTAEKTKEGMGWLKKTVIGGSLLAVAGVAGFFGVRWLRDYSKQMAHDVKNAIKEGATSATREIKAAASEARGEIVEHGKAAAERVRGAVDSGAKKLNEKRGDLMAKPATPASPDGPVAKAETAQEKAKEYAPGVAVYLLSKYLKSDKIADVYDVLKQRKLGEVLAAYDPVKKDADPAKVKAFSVAPSGSSAEVTVQYEQAAQKLVAFCGKRGPDARVLYERTRKPTDVPFDELTLEQYVLSLGGGLALAADAVEFSHDLSSWKPDLSLLKRIKEGSLSIGRKVRDLGEQRLSRLSAPLQNIEMKELVLYLPEADRGVFAKRSVRSVIAEAAQSRMSEEQIAALPPTEQRKARMRALVLEICERALPTGRELLPFFHRTFPDRAWGNDQAANEAIVDQYVQEMSVAQAIRFFSYWQMIRSRSTEEQVGGLVALQYEVLQFIDRRDAGYFGGMIKPKFKSAVVGLTEDLASPTFGQAIAEVAKVDASIVARAGEMLAEPAQRLAYYAGVVAFGPAKYLVEWSLGIWEKHPYGVPIVAGAAAYGLVSPARFMINAPFKLGWWWWTRRNPDIMARSLKATKPYNPIRWLRSKLYHPGASYAARLDASSHLSGILDEIRKLPVDEATRDALYKELDRCLQNGAKPHDLRNFSTAVDQAARGKPLSLFKELKQRTRTLVFTPAAERPRSALQLYARPLREQAANLRFVRSMRAAGLGGTMLWGAGLAGQLHAAVEGWREVGRKVENKKDVMTEAVNILIEIRQKLEQDGRFQVSPDGRSFVHKESGVVVDLKVAERQLTTVEGALDSGIIAQVGRASTDTAAFVGLAMIGPRLALGPAGLVLMGVELSIHGGIAVWEQSKMRNFILHSPPWVIAALGLQKTTGVSEDEWLNNASSWMITDVAKWFAITGPWGLKYLADPQSAERAWQANEQEKERIRNRVLFTLFCRDLRQNAPEVIGEILDGVDTPDAIDQFFERDFRSIILPFLSIALFTHAHGPMRWGNAREIDTDSGWVVVPPRMTMTQLRRAMREASIFALQHVREQRYVKLLALRQQMHNEGLGDQWEMAMAQVGAQSAFGQCLRESALTGREEKTRTELLLAEMLDRFHRTRGIAQPSLFIVSPESVPGLPSALDMRSPTVPYDFIEDPVQRLRLSTVRAETLGEEAAEQHRRWNDWSVSRILRPQSMVGQLDAFFYAAPFHVANMIAQKLGEPPVHENASVLEVLGRSRDAASYDAAKTYLTEGLDRLCSRMQGEPHRTSSYEELYGEHGPVVLTRGQMRPNRNLTRLIKYPQVEAAGFESKHLQAVLFEGQDLGGNHFGVLATYIFGDLESGRVSVLQRGAGTFMLASMPTPALIDGLDRPIPLQEFLVRPGAVQVLETARKALAERNVARETARKKEREEAQAVAESVDSKWKEEAPVRARQKQEREHMRIQLRERFKQAGTIGFVPGSFVEREQTAGQEQAFFEGAGRIEGRLQGTNVSYELRAIELDDRPSVSAQSKGYSGLYLPTHFRFRAERDGQTKEYDATLRMMRDAVSAHYTPEDLHLIREVLVTPMDLSAHPRVREPAFVEAVRKYELRRLLRMADYRSSAPYWSARDLENGLFNALWPLYEQSENKTLFLNTLLNNLLAEPVITGGVFNSPYRRILANMRSL